MEARGGGNDRKGSEKKGQEMSRGAVQKLAGRMYKALLKATGRLPSAKEIRHMENKALRTAERADNKKARG